MCGRSFILTVTLLRVVEMLIHFDRSLIIEQEGSLGRVFQVFNNYLFLFLNLYHKLFVSNIF